MRRQIGNCDPSIVIESSSAEPTQRVLFPLTSTYIFCERLVPSMALVHPLAPVSQFISMARL